MKGAMEQFFFQANKFKLIITMELEKWILNSEKGNLAFDDWHLFKNAHIKTIKFNMTTSRDHNKREGTLI